MSASGNGVVPKRKYKSVAPDTTPKNDEGKSLVDLYVFLPTSDKYIKWVLKGDDVDSRHVTKIKRHVDPVFYATEDSASDGATNKNPQQIETDNNNGDKRFQGERQKYESARLIVGSRLKKENTSDETGVSQKAGDFDSMKLLFGTEKAEDLAKHIDTELKDIYSDIGGAKPGDLTLQDSKLDKLSEKIISVVAPEIQDVRAHLKNIPAFVSIMDEASAISTLAILFAIAQGQKARGVFKDLGYACLLMDISLVGTSEDIKKKWLTAPETLNDAERILIETHPRKSQSMVMEKFKSIPEIVGQMILGHHELFSGRGFPRKVRSDLLPPVVRILAFAVDVHYFMKQAELQGERITIDAVVESFMDPGLEPHLRRHSIDLCRKISKYLLTGETD